MLYFTLFMNGPHPFSGEANVFEKKMKGKRFASSIMHDYPYLKELSPCSATLDNLKGIHFGSFKQLWKNRQFSQRIM